MKPHRQNHVLSVTVLAATLFGSAIQLPTATAATLFVWPDSAAPATPYGSWASAAQTIQEAVDAANANDEIVVTNGVYATGERFLGAYHFRLVVQKPVLVRSVQGPGVTVIQGQSIPGSGVGEGAIRCAYLNNGAILAGFTLTNGATPGTGFNGGEGGGVLAGSAVLSNCVITGNFAAGLGGGVYGGTLVQCRVTGNRAVYGGGAYSSTLLNCLLTGNSAFRAGGGATQCTMSQCTVVDNNAESGGGVANSRLTNCIVYYNSAGSLAEANYSPSFDGSTRLTYCCTTPLPEDGAGNISVEPFLTDVSHLSADSPCRAAGLADPAVAPDLDGDSWADPPSIGCDEFQEGPATGPLSVAIQASYLRVAVGFPVDFVGRIQGRARNNAWDFGDGTVTSNRLMFRHSWSAPGQYVVRWRAWNDSAPAGVDATLVIEVVEAVLHVRVDSVSPEWPFASWATAAATIQEAVDAAAPGALVVVSNGVYTTGGRAVYGRMTNRVAIDKPVTVRSLNGPEVTRIIGRQLPGTTNGDGAIRCAYLTNGAVLDGFTLAGGATLKTGLADKSQSGGGVYGESPGALVSHCLLTGNAASASGGAAYSGTLSHCRLAGNWATNGGGAAHATLDNCVLLGNSARRGGGGAYVSQLTQCTVVGNVAWEEGGGTYYGKLYNSIVYYNRARDGWSGDTFNSGLSYCFNPNSTLPGSVPGAPLFVDYAGGDLRLQANSPCIDAGYNALATSSTDLDGHPRIARLRVDVGAYEYQGPGLSPYVEWLQQHGLAVDGSADLTDDDDDGYKNWQEWVTDTDPTNPSSVFHLEGISSGPPATVQFVSSPRRLYTLTYADSFDEFGASPYWSSVPGQVNVAGTGGRQTLTDVGASAATNRFYRVSVRLP